jgi:CRISPR-associated protein Cas1
MNPLVLSGWGIKIRTENLKTESALELWTGHQNTIMPTRMKFRPRRIPYDSVITDGYSGYISLRGIHWLSRNNVPLYVLDLDGTLLSSILPATPIKADLRVAQIQAATNSEKKFQIAHALEKAKLARSLQVLDWIADAYDIQRQVQAAKGEVSRLGNARTVKDLLAVEARTAQRYWEAYAKILPLDLEFQGRMTTRHNNNASDPVNSALNFGYAVLEGECRRAINAVGLEAGVGFLHDFSDIETRQSLVYDLMEPYRWLIDLTVLQAFQSRVLRLETFHFKFDDYRFRLNPDAKEQFIGLLKEQFNRGVQYKGQRMKWDTVIQEKTSELARFLTGKASAVKFEKPNPILERTDDRELRSKILRLSSSQARELGIQKSTLHYLKRHASSPKPFVIYRETRQRLSA